MEDLDCKFEPVFLSEGHFTLIVLCACKPTLTYVVWFVLLNEADFVRWDWSLQIPTIGIRNVVMRSLLGGQIFLYNHSCFFLRCDQQFWSFRRRRCCIGQRSSGGARQSLFVSFLVLLRWGRLRLACWSGHGYFGLLKHVATVRANPVAKYSSSWLVATACRVGQYLFKVSCSCISHNSQHILVWTKIQSSQLGRTTRPRTRAMWELYCSYRHSWHVWDLPHCS